MERKSPSRHLKVGVRAQRTFWVGNPCLKRGDYPGLNRWLVCHAGNCTSLGGWLTFGGVFWVDAVPAGGCPILSRFVRKGGQHGPRLISVSKFLFIGPLFPPLQSAQGWAPSVVVVSRKNHTPVGGLLHFTYAFIPTGHTLSSGSSRSASIGLAVMTMYARYRHDVVFLQEHCARTGGASDWIGHPLLGCAIWNQKKARSPHAPKRLGTDRFADLSRTM